MSRPPGEPDSAIVTSPSRESTNTKSTFNKSCSQNFTPCHTKQGHMAHHKLLTCPQLHTTKQEYVACHKLLTADYK